MDARGAVAERLQQVMEMVGCGRRTSRVMSF